MTKFICNECKKTFAAKANLDYHIDNEVCKNRKLKCRYCPNTFSHSSSMYRHMKKCPNKGEDKCKSDNPQDSEKAELLKLIEDMQEQINKLRGGKESKSENNVTNNNINNGTMYNNSGDVNTMNITVNIVPFGKEDLSKIDKTELLKVFRSGFNSALRLTETTHFNPKYPEYHNVYISNMKNKYAMTFDGNDWALVMKDELIDKIYDNKRDYIEENMDEFFQSLLPSQINALHRWLNVDDDHQYVQKVKNDMKLMLYNKRKMALEPKPYVTNDEDDIGDTDDNDDSDVTLRVIKTPKTMVYDVEVLEDQKLRKIAPRNGRYRKTVAKRRR